MSSKTISKTLLDKALKLRNEYAWLSKDIEAVISHCRELEFAIIGGEVWLYVPGNSQVKELYWLDFETEDRDFDMRWKEYVDYTSNRYLQSFYNFESSIEIKKESMEYSPLAEIHFVVDFVSESMYEEISEEIRNLFN